jgi:hypothetical protein
MPAAQLWRGKLAPYHLLPALSGERDADRTAPIDTSLGDRIGSLGGKQFMLIPTHNATRVRPKELVEFTGLLWLCWKSDANLSLFLISLFSASFQGIWRFPPVISEFMAAFSPQEQSLAGEFPMRLFSESSAVCRAGTGNSDRKSLPLSRNALSLSGKRLSLSGIEVALSGKRLQPRGNGLRFGDWSMSLSGNAVLLSGKWCR